MPDYALKCPRCKHRFERFAPASERYVICCPRCATGPCDTDFEVTRFVTERRFAGSEMIDYQHGFHPDELGWAKATFKDHQHCIDDEGMVTFGSRAEERSFTKQWNEMAAQGEKRREERRNGVQADGAVQGPQVQDGGA